MSVVAKGQPDGSLAFIDSQDSRTLARFGGSSSGDGFVGVLAFRRPLAAVGTAGGVAAIANPVGRNVLISRAQLLINTATAGACTVSVGTAANGTTLSANLIDGANANAAAPVHYDNISNPGTLGKPSQLWGATQYVTVSQASGAIAGIAGYVYIHYMDP